MKIQKIDFEDGQLAQAGYVIVDGIRYETVEPVYNGKIPLNAQQLNALQENVEQAIEVVDANMDNKFSKTGGTIETNGYHGIMLKRNSSNGGSSIRFENKDGILGTVGFGSTKSFIITKDTGQDGKADLIEIKNDGTVNFFNEVIVSKNSGATYFRFRRTDTGVGIRFGVAQNGTKAGIYSENLEKWILSCEGDYIFLDGKSKSAEQLTDGTITITASDIGNISAILDAINGEVI